MGFSENTYEPTAAKALTKNAGAEKWILGLEALLSSYATDRLNYSDDPDSSKWAWVPGGHYIDAVANGSGRRILVDTLAGLTPVSGHMAGKLVAGKPGAITGGALGGILGPGIAAWENSSSTGAYRNTQEANLLREQLAAMKKGTPAVKNEFTGKLEGGSGGNDWATAAAIGTLGLGALGLGGYGLYRWLKARDEDKMRASKMKMRIKTPNGDDAVVEMPLVNPNMSPQLETDFNRGVTRGVRQIARHNSFKRDPESGKLLSYKDWYDKYGRLEEQGLTTGIKEKAAKVVGIPAQNLLENTVPKASEPEWRPVVPGKVRQMLDLEKQASRARQTNESIGNITAPLLAAVLMGGGAKLLGASNGAALGAAGAGAIGAPLFGAALSSFTPDRAQSEQDNMDAEGNGWENLVVPGLAQYNMLQRARALPDAIAVATRKAQGDPMPDLDGDGEPDVIPERMTITSDNLLSLDDNDFGMYAKK